MVIPLDQFDPSHLVHLFRPVQNPTRYFRGTAPDRRDEILYPRVVGSQ